MAEDSVEFVDLQFTDVMGQVKSVTIPVDVLERHRRRAVDRVVDRRVHSYLRVGHVLCPISPPTPIIPWTRGNGYTTARFINWVYNPDAKRSVRGGPASVYCCARSNAWPRWATPSRPARSWSFLFEKEGDDVEALPRDKGGYFGLSMDLAYAIRKDMVKALKNMGIAVRASHHSRCRSARDRLRVWPGHPNGGPRHHLQDRHAKAPHNSTACLHLHAQAD